MKHSVPYPFYSDNVPVDISFVFKDEKPAGRHGFLKVSGNRFVFEDGCEAKFWGTNFNGEANFPDFEYSEKVARRLSKLGINIVRLHQLDSEWNTPNIFRFTKGPLCDSTTELDAESMKHLDYLVYCLKNEGIYCYLDMFTYRKFKSGDGVINADKLLDAAKPYSYYDKRLIELQKKLCYDLWTHVNPYTGLAYKDDPVFVLTEITNENDLFCKPIELEPYVTEFRELFAVWIEKNGIDYDAYSCDVNDCDDKTVVDFKIYLQEKYYLDFMNYMHGLGVKIPITGTNWLTSNACSKTQMVTDFMDMHWYLYDWHWGEYEKYCMNLAITELPDCGFDRVSMMRSLEKPFFLSEWDMPWPNEFRAESPILAAAVGGLQNWMGLIIHTYSYTSSALRSMNILGKEISSAQIGGIPYRSGIFSAWNDPAKFGLFYHAALITRRGDVAQSGKQLEIRMDDLTGKKPAFTAEKKAFTAASELCAVGSKYENCTETNSTPADSYIVNMEKKEVRSDTGELYRNWEKSYGSIDTRMTKCAYGFLGKNEEIVLNGMQINCSTDFAVIAISSLSDDEIEKSENMLLTAVGRAENTGAVFEGEKMLEYGQPPVQIEVIEAEIRIKTQRCNLKIWAIGAEGFYIGLIPAEYENGYLKFELGRTSLSMYYLIQAE